MKSAVRVLVRDPDELSAETLGADRVISAENPFGVKVTYVPGTDRRGGMGCVGIEPTTSGLKVRCSTD